MSGVTNKDIITSTIMPNFDIDAGVQLSDTKTPNTTFFIGTVGGAKFHVGLFTRNTCVSLGKKGLWYSEIIVDDKLKDAK